MNITRIILLLLAVINMLGLVWFFGDLSVSTFIYGITSVSCALLVSLTPRNVIDSNKHFGVAMLLFCAIGIIAIVLLILQDYQRKYGADMGAIIVRLLFAAAFVFVGLEIGRRISTKD